MPNFCSSAAGPIPLSLRSCGVLYAPPARMTSLFAKATPGLPASAVLEARGSAR